MVLQSQLYRRTMRFLVHVLFSAIFIKIEKADGLDLNFLQNDYQVKFERAELVRYNKSFIKEASIKTFKYNRTTALVNGTFIPQINIGAEVECIIQAYKFMSNEYRIFPLHFAVNVCLGAIANVAGIRTGGIKCGNIRDCALIKDKEHYICNWQPDQSKLPPYIPDGQSKVELQMMLHLSEVIVVNGYATVFRPIV